MNTFLFDKHVYAELYNCSGRSFTEWKALGVPHRTFGFVFIVLGFVYWTTYLPFMVVFLKSNLLQHSCYKIMFFLGIVDCIAIPLGGFYCGWATIIGMNYCMYPELEYLTGVLGALCWGMGSTTCALLAFGRCVDTLSPRLARRLFAGRRTCLWLSIPVLYGVYIGFYCTAPTFNSILSAWFFDPFIFTPERNGTVDSVNVSLRLGAWAEMICAWVGVFQYPHMYHLVHNFVLVFVMGLCYFLICFTMYRLSRGTTEFRIHKVQRTMTIQAIVICSGTFSAALVYIYITFMPAPLWLIFIAELLWMTSHGMVGIVYIIFNKTMRKLAINLFWPKFVLQKPLSTNAITSTDPMPDHNNDEIFPNGEPHY